MSPWARVLVGLLAIKALASLVPNPGFALVAYNTVVYLLLLLLATTFALQNAAHDTNRSRLFWIFMAGGFALWAFDQGLYVYYGIGLRADVPDNSIADPALFLHVVPLMAAVAMQPHLCRPDQKPSRATLDFLLLLFFWVFLYAFALFPYQYLFANASIYNSRFTAFYAIENATLALALGILTLRAQPSWRPAYLHLFGASALYGVSSTLANIAIDSGWQYNGSVYSLAQTAAVCWFVWVPLSARQLPLSEARPAETDRASTGFLSLLGKMAVIAIPLIGMLELFKGHELPAIRTFRLAVVLASVLFLTAAVFVKERFAKRDLVLDSRTSKLQKRLSEAALVSSEDRYRDLVEALPDAIFVVQEEQIVFVNPCALSLLGAQRPEQVVGKKLSEIVHPSSLESIRSRIRSSRDAQVAAPPVEQVLLALDGSPVEIESASIPITWKGSPAIEKIARDIRQRKRTEAKLQEYEKALEGLEEMIVVVDREYRCVLVNRAYLNYRGMEREQVIGHSAEELAEGDIFETIVKKKLDECFEGKVVTYELKYRYPRLGERELLVTYFPIEGPDGIDRVVSVLQDVTERKKAHEELLLLKNELAAELASMTRLHEWSTRLMASAELQPLLEEILHATIELQNADFGNVQLYSPQSRTLQMVAQHGFQQDFLDRFREVRDDSATCGRALRRGSRVIVEDIQTDAAYEQYRQIAASVGFRAVQSTPLFGRSGQPLGVISTHFRSPHCPSERELRLTDLYARQAAELVEIKQAETRLREYEKVVEGLEEMIVVVDREYRYVLANRSFLTHRGVEREDLIGRPSREMLNEGVFDAVIKEKLDECFQGKVVKYELAYKYPKLGERNISISYFPIEGLDGVDHVACVIQDITERKRAEGALQRSEAEARARAEELEAILDAVPGMALISQDPQGRRITGSRVAYELLRLPYGVNISKSAPEGERPSNFRIVKDGTEFPPSELPVQKAAATGQVIRESEITLVFDDGTTREMLGNAAPLLDEAGLVRGAVGVFVDISERKRAEESLRLFRMLADQSTDAIEVVDPETLRFIDINDRACVDLDYTREELLSMKVYDIDPNVDESRHAKVLDDLRASGSVIIESLHRRKDGTTFPVEVSIKQVTLDRTYMIAVARDITERKRTEQALQESRAALTRVARIATMGELTASIAHEINQPLAAVVTNASASLHWLATQPPDLAEARQAMAGAMQEANRASSVVGRIRTLLNKASPEMRPLDVNELIREVLDLTHNQLLTSGVAVHTELASDIPTVFGDRVQVQQVMLNLIMNAIDAMTAISGRPRTLLIKSAKDAEGVLVQVEDSGQGIDPEQLPRIFDSFYTTKPQGIGMGLSISRSIIEAHDGRLWASPGTARGAVFQFILPIADGGA